jgi:hypothetical protein
MRAARSQHVDLLARRCHELTALVSARAAKEAGLNSVWRVAAGAVDKLGPGQSLRTRFSSLDSAIFPHSVRVKLCLSIPLDGPPGCCAVEAASFMLGATGKNYG